MARSFLKALPKTLYRAAKGRFLEGTYYQRQVDTTKPLDRLGFPEASFVQATCEGFVDGYRDQFRGATVRIDGVLNIFSQSIADIRPAKDDCVKFGGLVYQLSLIKTDPATAMWICAASLVQGNSQVTIDLLNALAKLSNQDLPR